MYHLNRLWPCTLPQYEMIYIHQHNGEVLFILLLLFLVFNIITIVTIVVLSLLYLLIIIIIVIFIIVTVIIIVIINIIIVIIVVIIIIINVVNYPMANSKTCLVILSFKYDHYFPVDIHERIYDCFGCYNLAILSSCSPFHNSMVSPLTCLCYCAIEQRQSIDWLYLSY